MAEESLGPERADGAEGRRIERRRRASIRRVNDVRFKELYEQVTMFSHEDVESEEFMRQGKRLNVEGVHLRLDKKNYPVDTNPQLTLCGLPADAESKCFYVTEPGSRYDLPTMIDLRETCEVCRTKAKDIMRMIALAGTSV